MNRLRSILVGVDFSDCSRSALEQGVRLGRATNARLHALHIVEDLRISDFQWSSQVSHEALADEAQAQAQQTLQHWLRESGAPAEAPALVATGAPIDHVLRQVGETRADLLVMGVTGSSMIPMGAGTLATKCLRKAPTKVMLVHERHSGPFCRVVAAVDFSDPSREAVAQALRVAGQDRAVVHFLHVFTGSWGRFPLVPDAWDVDEEKSTQYRRALEGHLRNFVGDLGGASARFGVIEASNHGHAIADYARRVRADLLVLGTKGRTNLGYVLLGSTVERVLREVPCSVLVVRPPAPGPVPPAAGSAARELP